jgi:hypothetical protein
MGILLFIFAFILGGVSSITAVIVVLIRILDQKTARVRVSIMKLSKCIYLQHSCSPVVDATEVNLTPIIRLR